MTLVSTDWLEKNLKNVKIFDASLKPNAQEEYLNMHIPGAIFFNIQEHSDKKTELENMLPSSDYWNKIMNSFGINNSDHICKFKLFRFSKTKTPGAISYYILTPGGI